MQLLVLAVNMPAFMPSQGTMVQLASNQGAHNVPHIEHKNKSKQVVVGKLCQQKQQDFHSMQQQQQCWTDWTFTVQMVCHLCVCVCEYIFFLLRWVDGPKHAEEPSNLVE